MKAKILVFLALVLTNLQMYCQPFKFGKQPRPTFAVLIKNPQNPKQKIMLLGTRHHLPLRILPAPLVKELKSFDILVTELKDERASLAEPLEQSLKKFITGMTKVIGNISWAVNTQSPYRAEGKPWAELLAAGDQALLTTVFKTYLNGLPLSHFNPSLMFKLLSAFAEFKFLVLSGMDMDLIHLFTIANKKILSLETIAERETKGLQEKALTQEQQTQFKNIVLNENTDEATENIKELLSDIHEEEKKSRLPKGETRDKYDQQYLNEGIDIKKHFTKPDLLAIDERSSVWVPRIITILKNNPNQSIVIAVGRTHVTGYADFEHGLIKLLEKQGFTIERVKY